jgi:hypothetical protein
VFAADSAWYVVTRYGHWSAVFVGSDVVVCGEREKFDEIFPKRQSFEHFCTFRVLAGGILAFAEEFPNLLQLLRQQRLEQFLGDFASVIQ